MKVADATPERVEAPPRVDAEPAPAPRPMAEPHVSPTTTVADRAHAEAARQVGRLLDRGGSRLVPLDLAAVDAPSLARVEEALRSVARRSPEYGRVALDEGGRPSTALVLTADPEEAERIVAALRRAYPAADVPAPAELPGGLARRLVEAAWVEYLLPERTAAAAAPRPKGVGKAKAAGGTLVLWLRSQRRDANR